MPAIGKIGQGDTLTIVGAKIAAAATCRSGVGTEHFQPSSLQVTTIDIGNPATNIAPGAARATFNIRFNDRWTSDALKAWVGEKLWAVGGRYQVAWEAALAEAENGARDPAERVRRARSWSATAAGQGLLAAILGKVVSGWAAGRR